MGVDHRRSRVFAADGGMDAQLQHAIERDVRTGQSRAVLALHVSRLQAPAPLAHHRRIAKAILDDAALSHAGQVFARSNADMVLICAPTGLDQLRTTLTRLFRADAPPQDRLMSQWSLPHDSTALESYLSRTIAAAPVRTDPSVASAVMAAMEAFVGATALAGLIGRQIAVRIGPDGMSPLYRELIFFVAALDAQLGAPGAAEADPYLYRHLATRLDDRMLEAVTAELGKADAPPASLALHLNLTVRTILSPVFLPLAEAIEAAGVRLGAEIAIIDACADPLAFAAARMVLRAHGASVVLDAIGYETLLLTRPDMLEPDLVKLAWSARLPELGAHECRLLVDAVQRIGPDRLLLDQVDSRAAMVWGMQHGISRFQGRHVDGLLPGGRPNAPPRPTPPAPFARPPEPFARPLGPRGRQATPSTLQ